MLIYEQHMNIHLVYYSATYTTRTVCRGVAESLGGNIIEYDVTNKCPESTVEIPSDDILVVGAPVYCGRVPEEASQRIAMFCGEHTQAIAVVVYGNRAFDDALLELHNIISSNGFTTISAAAFIGRHCIFPMVATERPDASDRDKMREFAAASMRLFGHATKPIQLPGNEEYCPHKKVPFCPMPTDACNNCGTCASLCPVGAISKDDVSIVDANKCITCGRCVLVCPQHGRQFMGDVYNQHAAGFAMAYGSYKVPEMFYSELL